MLNLTNLKSTKYAKHQERENDVSTIERPRIIVHLKFNKPEFSDFYRHYKYSNMTAI